MTHEPPKDDDLKALWREQETETPPMSLELIHARGFQWHIKRRNFIEYAAAVVVVATFSWYVYILSHPVMKLGSALTVLGTLVLVWQLHKRGSARQPPLGAAASLAFHRAELVRQRDAVRSMWLWYLAPLAPGMIVTMAGMAMSKPDAPLAAKLVMPVVTALVFVGVWLLNRRGARLLQRAIDDLDALNRE
jgi:hypothetical protein